MSLCVVAVGRPVAVGCGVDAVSYTHLTLPTSDLVEILVVGVSLKKKIEKQIKALAHNQHNQIQLMNTPEVVQEETELDVHTR